MFGGPVSRMVARWEYHPPASVVQAQLGHRDPYLVALTYVYSLCAIGMIFVAVVFVVVKAALDAAWVIPISWSLLLVGVLLLGGGLSAYIRSRPRPS